jgi:hypothetical protein
LPERHLGLLERSSQSKLHLLKRQFKDGKEK